MSKDKDVERAREGTAYDEWFHRMVEAGRLDVRSGRVASNEEVEARFAARRASDGTPRR